jgi:hypothetical protein
MTRNSDNRRRAFADVVTIDAWHDQFDNECKTADLHADVVFGTARLGGEAASQVRFRLSVKRAELVVITPETEPVSVEKTSVSRDAPEFQARKTGTVETTKQAKIEASADVSVSDRGFKGSIGTEVKAESSVTAKEKIETSQIVQLMLVTQSKTEDGNYRWVITPQAQKVLDGRPWDANKNPRMKLVDGRRNRSKGIPPTVRIEVHCLREDLEIQDIEIKDATLWEKLRPREAFRNKIVAAESYIRDRLAEEGLEAGHISDKFSFLTLARVTADPL